MQLQLYASRDCGSPTVPRAHQIASICAVQRRLVVYWGAGEVVSAKLHRCQSAGLKSSGECVSLLRLNAIEGIVDLGRRCR